MDKKGLIRSKNNKEALDGGKSTCNHDTQSSSNSLHQRKESSSCGSCGVCGMLRSPHPASEIVSQALSRAKALGKETCAVSFMEKNHGNRFTSHALHTLSSVRIQPKLVVNTPGDIYEQEADQVAEQVMRMPEQGSVAGRIVNPVRPAFIQRICTGCEEELQRQPMKEEEEVLQPKPLVNQITPLVQRRVLPSEKKKEETLQTKPIAGQYTPVPTDLQDRISALRGTGQSLSQSERAFFEPRLGTEFSQVRIHTDSRAAETARTLNARAFTLGQDITFGAGQYEPSSADGRRLLAHELTHVLQQRQSPYHQPVVGQASTSLFREMVPPYTNQPVVRSFASATQPMIQCDKIDYRALTWDDFKRKKVPGNSPYDAGTKSDFHDPEFKSVIPDNLEAADTGEECIISETKQGKITGHLFKVNIKIDPEAIKVRPYMWQEESWKKPWLTEPGAAEERCSKNLVKDAVTKCKTSFAKEYKQIDKSCQKNMKECETSFAKGYKQIDKDCKASQKQCEKHFKEGESSVTFTLADKEELTINSKSECKEVLVPKCKEASQKTLAWTANMPDGEELTINSKGECKDVFVPKCKEASQKTLVWTANMEGEEVTLTSKDECSKKLVEKCVEKSIPANSQRLLSHEQTHFDITKTIAEQTQEALRGIVSGFKQEEAYCGKGEGEKEQKASKKRAVSMAKKVLDNELKALKKEYSKGVKTWEKVQKVYDEQTKHGTVKETQHTWESELDKNIQEVLKPKKH